jgi:hypothetical protein
LPSEKRKERKKKKGIGGQQVWCAHAHKVASLLASAKLGSATPFCRQHVRNSAIDFIFRSVGLAGIGTCQNEVALRGTCQEPKVQNPVWGSC